MLPALALSPRGCHFDLETINLPISQTKTLKLGECRHSTQGARQSVVGLRLDRAPAGLQTTCSPITIAVQGSQRSFWRATQALWSLLLGSESCRRSREVVNVK